MRRHAALAAWIAAREGIAPGAALKAMCARLADDDIMIQTHLRNALCVFASRGRAEATAIKAAIGDRTLGHYGGQVVRRCDEILR